jgi:hypothetical protein
MKETLSWRQGGRLCRKIVLNINMNEKGSGNSNMEKTLIFRSSYFQKGFINNLKKDFESREKIYSGKNIILVKKRLKLV